MTRLPSRFRDLATVSADTWRLAVRAKGYLSEREANFLMAAAALSPVEGANLEIGSFKGRSTICIARICKYYGLGNVVAVDPHTSPSSTDPDLEGQASSFQDFQRNLSDADISDAVEVKRDFSQAVGESWTRPIRFLWIDGDHTYEGAKRDVDIFRRFLVPGSVVAMHDVLGTHYGSLRTFVEEILESADFGPAGYCGSIGWAQFRPDDGGSLRHSLQRKLLAITARQIIPVAKTGLGLVGWNKLRYKIWRPLAPHGPVNIRRLWKALSSFKPVAAHKN
ncbi:MAG: class I SAM-dependent methyltransferase [Gemmatimonadales bacterium]